MCDKKRKQGKEELDRKALSNLRQYLQIDTTTDTTDYCEAVKFLNCLATKIDLEFTMIKLCEKRPVVIMRWNGTAPCAQCIVLSSHMDVVPAEESKWDYPPFGGCIDDKGCIYGRGVQDMKCSGIQYVEAVRRLKLDGVQLRRNILILFVPDKESDSQEGLKMFIKKPEFMDLNIGLWIDESEGICCNKAYKLFHGEKHKYVVKFHLCGNDGPPWHNLQDTANDKLEKLLHLVNCRKIEEFQKAECNPEDPYTVSLNVVNIEPEGQPLLIPKKYIVTLDARLPPGSCKGDWKNTLISWCEEIGEGCDFEECFCEFIDKPTSLDHPYYDLFEETVKEAGMQLVPMYSCATTDARYARSVNIPAFGLSCLNGIKNGKHEENEFLEQEKFLKGIDIFYNLLLKVGNLPC